MTGMALKITWEQRNYWINDIVKTTIHRKKNEIGSLPHAIPKNKFQVEYNLKCEINI